jgi:hypothetical protein
MDPGRRKNLRREIVALLVGASVVAIGSLVLFVRGCDVGLFACVDEDVAKYQSQSGSYEARVYVRDCGATTTWATHVTLTQRRKLLPDITTLVFVADGNHGVAPVGPANGPEVRLQWLGNDRLALLHHRNARVFTSVPVFEDVKLEYQSFE